MGHVLLATGASSAIGLAVLRKIHPDYDHIIAHCRNINDGLSSLTDELGERMTLVRADLSVRSETEAMVKEIMERCPAPDHIIHFPSQRVVLRKFPKVPAESFGTGLEISLMSLVIVLKAFLPGMAKRKYGRVIAVLSSYTCGMPPAALSDYVTAKYAVLGLIKALASEYAGKGITVNGISPAYTETPFTSDMPETVREYIAELSLAQSPIGRNLIPDDIVPAVCRLLSEEADKVTGQNILITGEGGLNITDCPGSCL